MQKPEILLLKSQRPELHSHTAMVGWSQAEVVPEGMGFPAPQSPPFLINPCLQAPLVDLTFLTFLTLEFVTPGLVVESFGDRWMEACHGSPCPGSHCASHHCNQSVARLERQETSFQAQRAPLAGAEANSNCFSFFLCSSEKPPTPPSFLLTTCTPCCA